MSNKKFSGFPADFLRSGATISPTRIYLCFVSVAYAVAGVICAGLYLGKFGNIDPVSSYIFAGELMHSMIRSFSAATLMTLLIGLRTENN